MQLFDFDFFLLWQYYLGELRGDIFNKVSKITTPGSTNNCRFGLRYFSRTINRTTRWKTVRELIQNDTSVIMYKSMNNMTPTYLSDLFTCLSQLRSWDLRGPVVNLRPPLMATNTGQ